MPAMNWTMTSTRRRAWTSGLPWSPRRTPSSTRPRPRISAGHFGSVDASGTGWTPAEQDEGDTGANADRPGDPGHLVARLQRDTSGHHQRVGVGSARAGDTPTGYPIGIRSRQADARRGLHAGSFSPSRATARAQRG